MKRKKGGGSLISLLYICVMLDEILLVFRPGNNGGVH